MIYFGVRHGGPGMVRLSNPAGSHRVLLSLQRNPADVTGLCYAELALSNYPVGGGSGKNSEPYCIARHEHDCLEANLRFEESCSVLPLQTTQAPTNRAWR